MKIKLVIINLFLLIFTTIAFAAKEEIQVSAYYPAPFGDYENLKTNNLELLNVLSNPNTAQPASIDDFQPINFNKSIKVYGSTVGTYANSINVNPNDSAGFGSAVYNFIEMHPANNRKM